MDPVDKSHHSGTLAFNLLFLAFSVFLLSQLGTETRFSSRGGFFVQPRVWPAIGVCGMVAFGIAQVVAGRRTGLAGSLAEFGIWVLALEYLAWFMAYVAVVPLAGYLPSTIAFTTALAYRQGYRSLVSVSMAAALGAAIVFTFKSMLAVRIPGGLVYEYLPDGLRNFMIVNF